MYSNLAAFSNQHSFLTDVAIFIGFPGCLVHNKKSTHNSIHQAMSMKSNKKATAFATVKATMISDMFPLPPSMWLTVDVIQSKNALV